MNKKEILEGCDAQSVPSPFVKYEVVVQAQQTPGIVMLENYEQLKEGITNGVSYYSNFEYTLDNYQLALKHRDELKHVKYVLEKTKREIVKSYNAPLKTVERRIDELINLIKNPFKKIDTFIKQNEKESKKYEILEFAKACMISKGLIGHLENILNSPSFFEEKWLNSSCSRSTWRSAVLNKIQNAVTDVRHILSLKSDNVISILAHYYQTLSIDRVNEFIDSLQQASKFTTNQDNNNAFNNIEYIDEKEIKAEENSEGFHAETRSDSEILKCVANSINPYTGEVITGIDEALKGRLLAIINNIKVAHQPTDELFERLRAFSKEKAEEEGVAYWKILRKKTIYSLCTLLPVSKEELDTKKVLLRAEIKEKYGEEITQIIKDYISSDENRCFDGVNETKPKVTMGASMIGKPWSEDEEAELMVEFNEGLSISKIAKLHNRNSGGIRARLKKLGLIK